MKLMYKPVGNTRMMFEIEYETMADLWEKLAEIDELFSGEAMTCRKKDKGETTNVKFLVRQDADENKYYELVVDEPYTHPLARAKKAFGSHKKPKGGLFPKRKDAEGNYLPDNGWVIWDSELKKEV